MARITSDQDVIFFDGDLNPGDYRFVSSVFYRVAKKRGYGEITLNFNECSAAFPNVMTGLCALCCNYRAEGVTFLFRAPNDPKLRNLFYNANWAHFINPEEFPRDKYVSERHVPAFAFEDVAGATAAHTAIMRAILASLPALSRNSLRALEWCIWEITDNVVTHSLSRTGGIVQVLTVPGRSRRVQITVADTGIGIPRSFKSSSLRIKNDAHALELAIQEGVTSKPQNQGNGLYGAFRLAFESQQRFSLDSGLARLDLDRGNVSATQAHFPVPGTVISLGIDTGVPDLLEKALKFKEAKTVFANDFIEKNIETDDGSNIFCIKEQVISVGSRDAGTGIRNKIMNILNMIGESQLTIDFTDISIVSSSFADEVFGKLCLQMGILQFMSRIKITNIDSTVKALLDRAIQRRVSQGTLE
jgi:anti-sigma regulatory factor (Ser/Thr protein kinase)